MGIIALEGIVDRGRIRLISKVHLPEKTRVYVIVPGIQVAYITHILSPRLAHPEQAEDFRMEIVTEISYAGV